MSEKFADDKTTRVSSIPRPRIVSVALAVIDGPSRGKKGDVARGSARVGSSPGADLVLDDSTVSRFHCEVRVKPRGIFVRDLGSTNGTLAAGIRIVEAEVPPGTVLKLGQSAVRVDVGAEDVFDEPSAADHFGDLIGASLPMRRLYALLEKVAPSDATLLIRGDTGSGKEVVARSVHASSARKNGPFVAIDCGAIPENLFESEMFGHVRGAFTGAQADRAGAFEEAHGGTLFLDEVGELPIASQAKLLRALESRSVRRVGGTGNRQVDVRVIAATNRPLDRAINDGAFREDLYYRLAHIELVIPPLRERAEDIPVLAKHFFEARGGVGDLPPAFLEQLTQRAFSGNVRELKHHVERAMLFGLVDRAAGRVAPVIDVPVLDFAPLKLPFKEARDAWIEQFELVYVKQVLARANGNVTHAAELAGTNRRLIQRVVARLGIDPKSLAGQDEDDS
jgi:transcriptional regulator with GAF, ATPase, and Fis domain